MCNFIAPILIAFFVILSPTPVSDSAPIEYSTDANVGTIYLPEISEDDYYMPGDIFMVDESGTLFMVGTNYQTQSDVDWAILPSTNLPHGFYVLDATRGMVGVTADIVSPDHGA